VSFRVVFRSGPKVEKLNARTLDEALAVLEERCRAVDGVDAVDVRFRTFEPIQQVAARAELRGAAVPAGLDVRGDGSAEAWTGRLRRTPVAQQPGEDAYAALRRVVS
jgi:hypothetical protein